MDWARSLFESGEGPDDERIGAAVGLPEFFGHRFFQRTFAPLVVGGGADEEFHPAKAGALFADDLIEKGIITDRHGGQQFAAGNQQRFQIRNGREDLLRRARRLDI